jgi:hypothetical protein
MNRLEIDLEDMPAHMRRDLARTHKRRALANLAWAVAAMIGARVQDTDALGWALQVLLALAALRLAFQAAICIVAGMIAEGSLVRP